MVLGQTSFTVRFCSQNCECMEQLAFAHWSRIKAKSLCPTGRLRLINTKHRTPITADDLFAQARL